MKGAIYKYPTRRQKFHRWLIGYTNRDQRYIEENFLTESAAIQRINALGKRLVQADLFTRERVMTEKQLLGKKETK